MPRILLCQKSLSRGCSPLLLLLLLSVVSRLRGSAAAAFVGSSHLHRHPQQAITTTAQHQYGCFASSGLLFGKQPRHALHLSAPESSPDVGGSSAEADDTETIGSSNNSGSSGESTDDDDVVTEVTATEGDEPMVAAVVVENEEQQEAVGLLKQEIAALEAELKATRRQVADVSDRADEYTKSGYARAVAEMENMRRARSMLQSSNKFTATANVLTEFLPVVDTLNRLRVQYGTNEFGKQYNALPGAVVSGFVNLGCTDFIATIGENALDGMRYTVTASEYSDEWAKDYIVRVGTPGLELSGNVIRKAEVVASLGKQDTESTTESSDVAPLDKPENDVNKFA